LDGKKYESASGHRKDRGEKLIDELQLTGKLRSLINIQPLKRINQKIPGRIALPGI